MDSGKKIKLALFARFGALVLVGLVFGKAQTPSADAQQSSDSSSAVEKPPCINNIGDPGSSCQKSAPGEVFCYDGANLTGGVGAYLNSNLELMVQLGCFTFPDDQGSPMLMLWPSSDLDEAASWEVIVHGQRVWTRSRGQVAGAAPYKSIMSDKQVHDYECESAKKDAFLLNNKDPMARMMGKSAIETACSAGAK